jgi:hypothetical protein
VGHVEAFEPEYVQSAVGEVVRRGTADAADADDDRVVTICHTPVDGRVGCIASVHSVA